MEFEKLNLRLDTELKTKLLELAKINDLDMSKQIRSLIRQAYVNQFSNSSLSEALNSGNGTYKP